jgi:hypothetical protein
VSRASGTVASARPAIKKYRTRRLTTTSTEGSDPRGNVGAPYGKDPESVNRKKDEEMALGRRDGLLASVPRGGPMMVNEVVHIRQHVREEKNVARLRAWVEKLLGHAADLEREMSALKRTMPAISTAG